MLAGGGRGGPRHLPGSAAAAETLLDCNINTKKKKVGFRPAVRSCAVVQCEQASEFLKKHTPVFTVTSECKKI